MSFDTKQLVQPIRDSKRLVQPIPVERKLDFQYLGKDGQTYATAGALQRANEDWKRQTLRYIGKDGRTYSTSEELHQADEDWKRRTFSKKD